MKTITTLLTALALCTTTVAWAEDIVIPTDDGHPFDLTKGEITSSSTRAHFTSSRGMSIRMTVNIVIP